MFLFLCMSMSMNNNLCMIVVMGMEDSLSHHTQNSEFLGFDLPICMSMNKDLCMNVMMDVVACPPI